MDDTTWADWLRHAISTRGWSARDLASRAGVSPSTVGSHLDGGMPSAPTVAQMLDGLAASPAERGAAWAAFHRAINARVAALAALARRQP